MITEAFVWTLHILVKSLCYLLKMALEVATPILDMGSDMFDTIF